jgi:hypothetical protein
MRKLVWIAIPFALLASASASAQGTPEQREACNDDAFRFCNDDVPDAIAVEKCLRAHMRALSPKCRREFGASGKSRRAPQE